MRTFKFKYTLLTCDLDLKPFQQYVHANRSHDRFYRIYWPLIRNWTNLVRRVVRLTVKVHVVFRATVDVL